MKLALFGATGKTGQHVVQQALDRGYAVSVLVRTPSKLTVSHRNLTVIQGDIRDAEKVNQVVAGVDAVLSVLGPSNNQPEMTISQGTALILNAMQTYNVSRLIVSAGAGVADPKDQPKLFHRLIPLLLKLISRNVYEDMVHVVQQVRASDRDWTIVRVPMLTDQGATGDIRVGWVGVNTGSRLSRADMARFMLDQLDDTSFIGQAPAISN